MDSEFDPKPLRTFWIEYRLIRQVHATAPPNPEDPPLVFGVLFFLEATFAGQVPAVFRVHRNTRRMLSHSAAPLT
jgi:hypothetical protein